jgi:hypothetical protein
VALLAGGFEAELPPLGAAIPGSISLFALHVALTATGAFLVGRDLHTREITNTLRWAGPAIAAAAITIALIASRSLTSPRAAVLLVGVAVLAAIGGTFAYCRLIRTSARALDPRPVRAEPPPYPRHGFYKGGLVALIVTVPGLASALYVLTTLGFAEADARYDRIVRFAFAFAGLPTVLTGAGIGRLCSRAAASYGRRRVGRSMLVGARTFAVAGIALLVLAAIPLGALPHELWRWSVVGLGGALVGAISGVLVGFWAAGGSTTSARRAILRSP